MSVLKNSRGMLVTAMIALAVGAASYAIVSSDPHAERTRQLFTLDLSSLYEVDPTLIRFERTGEIRLEMTSVRALDVGPDDKIYVAGDKGVHVFAPDGTQLADVRTEGTPSCIAIAQDGVGLPGTIYVGAGKKIEVFSPDGVPVASWSVPSDDPILTSIAVTSNGVFVADAGNHVLLRYGESGELMGKIGEDSKERAFNVPSSYFDIASNREGLLHVVNPGQLRIETYTPEGQMEVRWGAAGSKIDHFFGCCNPSHIAVLPNGGVVTSEKGVPRIKVYSEFGEFECVVAGPKQLDVLEAELGDPRAVQAKAVFDVATDSQGRILALDPRKKTVVVFSRVEGEDADEESS